MKDEIINIVLFFYKRVSGSEPIIKEKDIDTFISRISKEYTIEGVGDWFLWNFFSFQFSYWENKKTRFEGKIQVNWLIGPKAIERWKSKDDSWEYFSSEFLKNNDIIKPVSYYKENFKGVFENERRKYLNTEEGLINCLDFSTFNQRSPSCIICKFKRVCREMI